MSEWNLSVRLTGQGSDLATTLKESAKEARKLTNRINDAKQALTELRAEAAGNITVRLDIDAAHLRNDVSSALTTAGSGQGLRVRLDLDADHLRDDVNAAITAAGSGQGLGVNLRLSDTMQLRREVDAAVRWAAWGHRIEIPIGLADPMQLRRDVSAAVRWASMNQTITVRVTPDTSALNGLNNTINAGGGGSSGSTNRKGLLAGLLTLAPAAIPLVSGLSTALVPLTGMLAAGGAAATAFGIAVAGQIEPLSEVADAEKKYRDAVRDHGQASAEALTAQIAYQKQLAALPPDTQRAAIALSQLKQNFGDWSDSMSAFTMTPLTNGITVLDQLIPRLTPEVKSASTQINRLVGVAGGAVNTPGFDAMADRFADFTDHQLDEMTDQVMHFLRILSEGGAFKSGPIAEFMAYAKQNGPAAREALTAISDALVTLLRGAAQAGPGMLTLVTAAAKLVAALPPELVGIILSVASALKILQLTGAGFTALAGGLASVRGAIAGMATASAAAGGGVVGLSAAFASLGTAAKATLIASGIGILLLALTQLSAMGKKTPPDVDKLTSSLRTLASTGKISGEAARSFGKDLSGLADSLQKVTDPKGLDQVQQSIVSFFGTDSTPIKDAKENIDAVDKALANLVKNGQADLAAQALDGISKKLKDQGFSAKEISGQMDDYKSALSDAKFEQELAAQSMGLFGKAAQDTQAKLDAQKASADGLRQSIQALNDVNRAGAGAMNAFEQSIDDAATAATTNAGALRMQHGELNLNSQKARDAESALRDLAANTDDAAAKAREQGKSWEYVQGIMTRGQKAFVDTAVKMGLTKTQADALAQSYLGIPDKKSTTLEMRTEDAIASLDKVAGAIKKTPDKKSVTVDALTTDAITLLEGLGFKVEHLKNGQFKVTADTSTVGGSLKAVETARDGLKDKTLHVAAATSGAVQSLQQVQDKIKATNGKTITMKAPTGAAIKALEALGFKVHAVPGSKNVRITIPTGNASAAVGSIQGYINSVHGKTVTVRINGVATGVDPSKYYSQGPHATGGLIHRAAGGPVRRFADGGKADTIQYIPFGGAIAGPGTGTSDSIPALISNGEYVIRASSVRKYGLGLFDRLNTGRFAAGGTAFAGGGFTYTPTGTMKSASDVQSSYSSSHQPITKDQYNKTLRARANATDSLRAAEARLAQVRKHKHTHAQLVAAENAVAKARRGVATATDAAKSAEARYKKQFNLSDWGKTLASAVKSNAAYESNLKKIATRGGSDVVDQLRDMGAEGATMVAALAKASKSQFNSIVANLRKLAPLAKATLADYTAQLSASNKTSSTFQANLAKLAGMGYGDLATQLAAQGDEAAQKLAASAVKDKGAASKANTAAKTAGQALTSEQVSELVQIIAAIKTKSTGIHAVAATTSLGEDEIIAVATKAKSQIFSSLGSRSSQFLADLARANKGLSYADGGIRAGIYATRGGAVTFAEPETGGEAFLPLSPSKRRSALPVLNDVARRFGVGLTDVAASRGVVVIREGGDTHVQVTAVRTGATASDIGSQVGRSVRRARRGGVAARAA
jgi:hypothetical protein